MRKLFLFLVLSIVLSTAVSCSESSEDAPKKNYYGVEPENHGVPKKAYYTLFGTVAVLGILVIYGINKVKNKK